MWRNFEHNLGRRHFIVTMFSLEIMEFAESIFAIYSHTFYYFLYDRMASHKVDVSQILDVVDL